MDRRVIYLLALDGLRAVAIGDLLGQALGHRSLTDSRLTNEAGVVLCPPAQNLGNTLDLLLTADHRVKLALQAAEADEYMSGSLHSHVIKMAKKWLPWKETAFLGKTPFDRPYQPDCCGL